METPATKWQPIATAPRDTPILVTDGKVRERGESAPWRKEFSELVRQGQMVRAIKLHREKTGSTLKEAKKAHDDERELVRREKLS